MKHVERRRMTKRNRNRHRTESIPLFALGLVMACATALADEGALLPRDALPPTEPFEAELVSQEHLNRYVHALVEVEAIQAEAIAEIDAAADGAAAQDIRERAEARILDAIYDNDLTSTKYNQLAGVVALDPELQARVEAKRAALETP
jgi:hypothetical protein